MPRIGLDKKTTGDLVRLLIFMLTTGLATGLLVITIGNLSFGATKEYKAEFVDATGVVNGDDIRVAGVKVGTVQNIEVVENTRALVTFSVDADTPARRVDPRHHQVPQPAGPALHLAHPRGQGRRPGARRG